jgi:hypothetical protein
MNDTVPYRCLAVVVAGVYKHTLRGKNITQMFRIYRLINKCTHSYSHIHTHTFIHTHTNVHTPIDHLL